MKLASFELSGETKIGIMTDKDQNLIDLRAAGCEHFRSQGDSHAAERARAMFPSDMVTFLEGGDVTLEMAKEVVLNTGQASTSLLQRRLRLGYGRAARILDLMEQEGIVGPPQGSRPREILVSRDAVEQKADT